MRSLHPAKLKLDTSALSVLLRLDARQLARDGFPRTDTMAKSRLTTLKKSKPVILTAATAV